MIANNKGTCYVYRPQDSIKFDEAKDDDEPQSPSLKSSASRDKNVERKEIWIGDQQYVQTNKFQAHNTYCLKCKLSPDNQFLATTSSGCNHTLTLTFFILFLLFVCLFVSFC